MKDERKYNFLERHYIEWRLSDDPMAHGAGALGCYAVVNDLTEEASARVEEAWQHFKKFHPEVEAGLLATEPKTEPMETVCVDCGHEQDDMSACKSCGSYRVVLCSVMVEACGEKWRDLITPKTPPKSDGAETDDTVKLRMKVWTDSDGKRWLLANAMTSREALAAGLPMKAYVMRDAACKIIELTNEQYNALPYSMFVETERGLASPGKRPQGVIAL